MARPLFPTLFGDPHTRAVAAEKAGRKADALKLYAKGSDHKKAAKIAVDLRDAPAAVDQILRTLYGRIPKGYEGLDARQTAEFLAQAGKLKEALSLFDLAEDWSQAAGLALRLGRTEQAAHYFERDEAYDEAANCYQRLDRPADALRVLDLEVKRLREMKRRRSDPAVDQVLATIEGKKRAIAASQTASDAENCKPKAEGSRSARQLEQSGHVREAIEAFLAGGEKDQALRLLHAKRGLDRRFRLDVLRRTGQPVEAARLAVSLGSMREAAELFEQGRDWARAAAAWESAGEPLRAAAAFERAGRWPDAGRCLLAGGQPAEAARAFERGKDLLGAASAYEQAGRRLEAAEAFRKSGDAARAARVLRAVPADDLEFSAATLALAPLLLEIKAFDEALARLESLAAGGAGSASAETLYWLGRVLEAIGSDPEALARYRLAVTLDPGHADAQKRRDQLAARQPRSAPGGDSGIWPTGYRLANRYEILELIGKGGMGCVYKARDRDLGAIVAIKTVLRGPGESSSEHEERLHREIQICRRIDHPNVVRVFDLGRFPGGLFLTMELLEGEKLSELMRDVDPMPLPKVRRILSEIAAGLGEAHALHIVHRDLKPSNVILTKRRVKILDFGVAKTADDVHLTQAGFAVGTPLYMSPEQLQGQEVDGRSDLYSLGILAFALLAGHEPFLGETFTAIALNHLQSPVPDLHRIRPDLPRPWIGLVEMLLEKRPDDRPHEADDVIAALAALPT